MQDPQDSRSPSNGGGDGHPLCFLPPYSPQLNPVEIIWKTMKRVLSRFNQTSRGQVESVVMDTFSKESAKLSYALGW
ncbi:transposase, partial [Candidatus Methanarcanum hacksteinii]|uniref:transposase n=1 Tax=Candidatus Methanarcanum hacksteinii TaxID=2911857 RepID=UPI0037DD2C92